MNRIHKGFKILKDKIKHTPENRLEALKRSIAISELHPQVKEAAMFDIDQRMNKIKVAMIEYSENIDLD